MQQIICTVDVVLMTLQDDTLKVALLRRDREPFKGVAALPGGFIRQQEDADTRDAAIRVLRDKTAIEPPYLEQLATFSGPARDPRGWSVSVVYYALVPFEVIAGAGHPDVKLVSVDKPLSLPFDHRLVIDTAVARFGSRGTATAVPAHAGP